MLVALVAQALPVSLLAKPVAAAKCTMSCCACAGTDTVAACDCVRAPNAPAPVAPASTPPANGLERAPQVVWAELAETEAVQAESVWKKILQCENLQVLPPNASHVRLPVLHCALLN